MLATRFSRIVIAFVLAGFFFQSTARAQSFRVAHTSDGFSSFIYVAINDSGEVVFSAIKTNGLIGVYKSAGTGFKPLIEGEVDFMTASGQTAPFRAVNGPVAINASGTIAIEGSSQVLGGIVIYVGRDALNSQSYQDNRSAFTVFNSALVLSGNFTLNDQGAFSLGALSVIPPTVPLAFDQCFPCFGQGMDDQNEVAHINRGGGTLGGTVDLIRLGYVQNSGPFSSLVPVATNHIATIPVDMFANDPELNSFGMVAYAGNRTNGITGIYTGSGVPVVESPPGGTAEFVLRSINIGLNNNGGVAFLASSRTWGSSRAGFFRGSNPLTDKIVVEGDTVAGSPLAGFGFPPLNGNTSGHWYNTAGQVVFQAGDAHGVGLYVTSGVASSPPETNSAVIEWVGPNDPPPGTPPNGSFTDTTAWKPLNGDPPRVPQKTATLSDTALFDRAEQYTVDLGTEDADRMIVKNGNVTFTNGWIALDALSFTEPSVIVDNARLTLSFNPAEVLVTPMVTCNHALIGQLAAARVDIINNTSWLATGSLRVGGPGEGILTLDSGGTVTSGESRIGGAGGGHVNLGAGGSWRTGNLAVGSEGQGDLTIQDGGHVDSDAGFIGLPGSSGSKVILQGGDGNNVSRWDVPYLAVGGGASGELDVKDGALVNSAMAIIAHVAGGDGSVTVSGVGTNGQSSTLSALELLAGQNGNAALNVLDGARVVAGNIFLGEFRSSVSVKVSGINVAEDTPSTLHADGVLAVGDVGPASLLIESGGQAESDWGQIANFVPQTISEVKIVGSASSWTVTNTLTLGYNGSVNAGQSVLTLVAGYLEADSIEVDNGGIVRGFGTLAVDPTNRVVNAGGTISPGLSPGIIIIDGSFKQLAGGQLLMDIGGTNYADNDHLIITNAANLDGNITFRFLNGFAPKQGQQFELLSVGGALTGNFATVGIENLAPGFQFGVVTNGRALSLVASNDGVFSAALPGEVDVTVTNFGGLTYANYTITTSNSCQSIALDGSFTQTGNAFTQTLAGTSFIRSDCANGILIVTNTLLLGALAAGDYSLTTMSAGQTMNTLSFTVLANESRTFLMPTLLPDGSLQFQVAGPQSSLHCTIQASPDLKAWVNLATGTLPFTFTDPDAALYSQRYYRALIGP